MQFFRSLERKVSKFRKSADTQQGAAGSATNNKAGPTPPPAASGADASAAKSRNSDANAGKASGPLRLNSVAPSMYTVAGPAPPPAASGGSGKAHASAASCKLPPPPRSAKSRISAAKDGNASGTTQHPKAQESAPQAVSAANNEAGPAPPTAASDDSGTANAHENSTQRLQLAKEEKEKGDRLFCQGKYTEAEESYTEATVRAKTVRTEEGAKLGKLCEAALALVFLETDTGTPHAAKSRISAANAANASGTTQHPRLVGISLATANAQESALQAVSAANNEAGPAPPTAASDDSGTANAHENSTQRLQLAKEEKEKGDRLFCQGKYAEAEDWYAEAAVRAKTVRTEEGAKLGKLCEAALALVFLETDTASRVCKASHVKALCCRAKAFKKVGKPLEALVDLTEAQMCTSDGEVLELLEEVSRECQELQEADGFCTPNEPQAAGPEGLEVAGRVEAAQGGGLPPAVEDAMVTLSTQWVNFAPEEDEALCPKAAEGAAAGAGMEDEGESQSVWEIAGAALEALALGDQSLGLETRIVHAQYLHLIAAAREVVATAECSEQEGLDAVVMDFMAADEAVSAVRGEILEAQKSSPRAERGEADAAAGADQAEIALLEKRDKKVQLLMDWVEKLNEYCGEERAAEAKARLSVIQGAVLPSVAALHCALGCEALPQRGLSLTASAAELRGLLKTFDDWRGQQYGRALERQEQTAQALSELSSSLREFAIALEGRVTPAALPPTSSCVDRLAGLLALHRRFPEEAAQDFRNNVQELLAPACSALLCALQLEEGALLRLLAARERAAALVVTSPQRRKEVMAALERLHGQYDAALHFYKVAKVASACPVQPRAAQLGRVDEEQEAETPTEKLVVMCREFSDGNMLSDAAAKLAAIRRSIDTEWVQVHVLAAGPYPELPREAIRKLPSILDGLHTVDGVDLFRPCARKEHYQQLRKISTAGKESRNSVWVAEANEGAGGGRAVVLKEYELGPAGQAGQQECRTMQREVKVLARLKHPNVIAAEGFFLQKSEERGSLLCFVQFPFYPGGDLGHWLESAEAKALQACDAAQLQAQVRVVLLDALRGLEHVHYHGVVHCDVKNSNVLLGEPQGGLRRAVLADFDLSRDQQQRRQQMSLLSSQASAFAPSCTPTGPRGTPGVLTLAPEVTAEQQPTAKSDMFSFGGMALLALDPEAAEAWVQLRQAGSSLWDEGGAPKLEREGVFALGLLRRLLALDPAARPSASEALADESFAALSAGEHRSAAEKLAALAAAKQELEAAREAHALAVREQMEELVQRRAHTERCAEEAKLFEERVAREQEELQEREREVADLQKTVLEMFHSRVPPYWKHQGSGVELVRNPYMRPKLQEWMRAAVFGPAGDHQCGGCGAPVLSAKVTRVERVENGHLWQLYQTKKEMLKAAHEGVAIPSLLAKTKQPKLPHVELSGALNELFLFHGTQHETALSIARHGFYTRMSALTSLYGAGSYFSDSSCKANQYATPPRATPNKDGEFAMLLCRVTMGWPHMTTERHRNEIRPPNNPSVPGRPFDSIFAESGVAAGPPGAGGTKQVHNEYVVFDQDLVYPEYIIYYKLDA